MGISQAIFRTAGLIDQISLNAYLLSLSPTLYCKFNETSGNLINYGSDGNSGTVTACTQGQAGQLGANEAYSLDGDTSVITFANADIAGTKALTTQRWCFLVKANSQGESDGGAFYVWGDSTNARMQFTGTLRLIVTLDTDGTDAQVITQDNTVDFLTAWALVFVDYDDANALGLGRKVRILRATAASATTLLAPITDTAGTGTIITQATTLNLGNRNNATRGFDGLFDIVFCGAGLWSPAGSPADLTIPNAIRSLVF